MKYEDFAKHQLFQHLADINGFNLFINIPQLPGKIDEVVADQVVGALYDEVRKITKEAGFFHHYDLVPVREPDRVGVRYDDDRFNFELLWTNGRVSLRRRGSRMKNFHNWYTAFMPSARSIMASSSTILSDNLKRKMEILRAGFQFEFVIYDIRLDQPNAPIVRNSQIMERLVTGFPNSNGVVKAIEEQDDRISTARVDWAVSQWV